MTLFEELLAGCAGDGEAGAIRVRATYEPVAGRGAKVFPPTYAIDGKYVTERRYRDGEAHDAVVLDAVQSEANRLEVALEDAVSFDGLTLPFVTVEADIDSNGFRVSSLTAPHRTADAYFRDSQFPDGTAFDDSPIGAAVLTADERHARAIFEQSPTDLLLGFWNSQRRKRGARVPRSYTSEIVAYDQQSGRRAAGRLDPYNLQAGGVVYDKNDPAVWSASDDLPAGVKATKGKPSNINHGNALASDKDSPGGFSVGDIERTAVISMGVLRRLSFPAGDAAPDPAVDVAGRAVLAALGMLGDRLAFGGPTLFLRSGCDLVTLTDDIEWVLRGGLVRSFELDASDARSLYEEAVTHAASLGLSFNPEPVRLEPKPNLRQLLAINFATASPDE